MLASLVTVVFLFAGAAGTAQEGNADGLGDKLSFVEKLLNDSSAARQVEASGNETALALRAEANDKYVAALQERRSGNDEAAAVELAEAMRLMFAAVAASQPGRTGREQEQREFSSRRATVDALLSAHQRISIEKNRREQHDLLRGAITPDLNRADELIESDQPLQALEHLEAVYDKVKAAVMDLRDGDTLVRELRFESDEDEYDYELDRNDSHKMLVVVLLEDRIEDEGIRERIAPMIAAATGLRTAAEQQAEDGKTRQAIATLEESTNQLVQAIRSAGVYIPD